MAHPVRPHSYIKVNGYIYVNFSVYAYFILTAILIVWSQHSTDGQFLHRKVLFSMGLLKIWAICLFFSSFSTDETSFEPWGLNVFLLSSYVLTWVLYRLEHAVTVGFIIELLHAVKFIFFSFYEETSNLWSLFAGLWKGLSFMHNASLFVWVKIIVNERLTTCELRVLKSWGCTRPYWEVKDLEK